MLDWRALQRWLFIAVACISILGLAIELVHARSHADLVETLLELLSLSYEENVPTYVSAALLASCAVMATSIALASTALRWHWWGIAVVAGWMAIDEALEIHEHLAGHFETSGVLYFDWVIPATGIVLALALLYVPFVRRLVAPTRMRLVTAAAVYISGALVMELPLGWWTERHGSDGLGYALIDWVEETLEMVGVSLALLALVRHRQEYTVQGQG